MIFISAKSEEKDKARAFAVGASDYLTKPFDVKTLSAKVKSALERKKSWVAPALPRAALKTPGTFGEFRRHILETLAPEVKKNIQAAGAAGNLEKLAAALDLPRKGLAQSAALHLGLKFLPLINPDELELGAIPPSFLKANSVLLLNKDGRRTAVITEPFDFQLCDTLKASLGEDCEMAVGDPEMVAALLNPETPNREPGFDLSAAAPVPAAPGGTETSPVRYITSRLFELSIKERASDIHLEPKEKDIAVRLRVDGDMKDFMTFETEIGVMVISRLKAMAGMDIAERRRPQDGSFSGSLGGERFIFRLATTSTIFGESLIIRIVRPEAKAKDALELGLSAPQAELFKGFARRQQGVLLVVGPTGSGKTTTIYSLLSGMDLRKRSLITVEDPVEFRIPSANHQQVNEKAGVTFEALLKSSVRQDPDILFLGETRDAHSAKILLDFASTGHLVITTMHTSNASTALFRLERLGISRAIM
ncbi:MAG: hypothetical protein A3J79_03370, partial [Elusimicrobia bacterium RIFOXYB2_FULL_62_6]